jgi:hypothetical protein
MGRIPAIAIGAATCATLLASGCAAAGSSSPAKGPAASVAATTTPEQQAKLAVTALLGAFVPPPGAERLAGQPASAAGRLDSVGSFSSGDEVQQTTWWLAPGESQALLSWEGTHLPRPFFSSFSSSGGSPTTGYAYSQAYARPASEAVSHQYLIMSVTDVAGGQVAIRVDADASWQPVRSASEKVPATAKVVTISLLSPLAGNGKVPPPVTITDPAVTARVAAVINGLKVYTGLTECMTSPPVRVKLVFSATPGGPPLAVAQNTSDSCPFSDLTVGASRTRLFFDGTTVRQVSAVAGLHWKTP